MSRYRRRACNAIVSRARTRHQRLTVFRLEESGKVAPEYSRWIVIIVVYHIRSQGKLRTCSSTFLNLIDIIARCLVERQREYQGEVVVLRPIVLLPKQLRCHLSVESSQSSLGSRLWIEVRQGRVDLSGLTLRCCYNGSTE